MESIEDKLSSWVERGLISAEQARAIRAAEEESPSGTGRGGVSFAGEALAYVGGALLVGAVLVAFGDVWEDFVPRTRVTILAATTLLLMAGGNALRSKEDPALDRAAGVLWFMGVGIFSLLAYTFGDRVVGIEDETTLAVGAGATTAAFAYPFWRMRCEALQQTAVFAAASAALFAFGFLDWAANGETFAGLLVAALGSVWLAGSQIGRIMPRRTAEALGCIGILVGMQTAAFDEAGWFFVAMVVATGILALGMGRSRNILLGLGAAGLFVFVPQFITEAFGASVGAAGAIAIAGIVIIGIAAFVSRARKAD